ncbi:transglutaminase family protein [Thermoproteota archaeon]
MVTIGLVYPVVLGKEPTRYVYSLSYMFENRGAIDLLLTQEDVTIPLFMNASHQIVKLEEVSQDYEVDVIDVDGNKGAVIGLGRLLLPGKKESFTASYTISSSDWEKPMFSLEEAEGFDSIPAELIEEYCIASETFPKNEAIFKENVKTIVESDDSVLESVTSLVEYIMQNTTYHNFDDPQYPSATLQNHLGDCDDLSILIITMCRSLGIPAYLQVGIYINPNIEDKNIRWDGHLANEADGVGWHGWAMIYIPPWGWVPVDLTLTNAESGLDLIKQAPEYNSNIVPVLNVSRQSYIGNTLATRDRIINSPLYVTVSNEAHIVNITGNPLQSYLLLGLGAALLVAIGLMFRSINA